MRKLNFVDAFKIALVQLLYTFLISIPLLLLIAGVLGYIFMGDIKNLVDNFATFRLYFDPIHLMQEARTHFVQIVAILGVSLLILLVIVFDIFRWSLKKSGSRQYRDFKLSFDKSFKTLPLFLYILFLRIASVIVIGCAMIYWALPKSNLQFIFHLIAFGLEIVCLQWYLNKNIANKTVAYTGVNQSVKKSKSEQVIERVVAEVKDEGAKIKKAVEKKSAPKKASVKKEVSSTKKAPTDTPAKAKKVPAKKPALKKKISDKPTQKPKK